MNTILFLKSFSKVTLYNAAALLAARALSHTLYLGRDWLSITHHTPTWYAGASIAAYSVYTLCHTKHTLAGNVECALPPNPRSHVC